MSEQPYLKAVELLPGDDLPYAIGEEVLAPHWDSDKGCWQVIISYYPEDDEDDEDEDEGAV